MANAKKNFFWPSFQPHHQSSPIRLFFRNDISSQRMISVANQRIFTNLVGDPDIFALTREQIQRFYLVDDSFLKF